MKFTKEELLERLKAEITGKDQEMVMSVRTFNSNGERLYKRLEKANNDEELETVVTEYLPDFIEINKNIRKEKADFAVDWKKNHPEAKQEKRQWGGSEPFRNGKETARAFGGFGKKGIGI